MHAKLHSLALARVLVWKRTTSALPPLCTRSNVEATDRFHRLHTHGSRSCESAAPCCCSCCEGPFEGSLRPPKENDAVMAAPFACFGFVVRLEQFWCCC